MRIKTTKNKASQQQSPGFSRNPQYFWPAIAAAVGCCFQSSRGGEKEGSPRKGGQEAVPEGEEVEEAQTRSQTQKEQVCLITFPQ